MSWVIFAFIIGAVLGFLLGGLVLSGIWSLIKKKLDPNAAAEALQNPNLPFIESQLYLDGEMRYKVWNKKPNPGMWWNYEEAPKLLDGDGFELYAHDGIAVTSKDKWIDEVKWLFKTRDEAEEVLIKYLNRDRAHFGIVSKDLEALEDVLITRQLDAMKREWNP